MSRRCLKTLSDIFVVLSILWLIVISSRSRSSHVSSDKSTTEQSKLLGHVTINGEIKGFPLPSHRTVIVFFVIARSVLKLSLYQGTWLPRYQSSVVWDYVGAFSLLQRTLQIILVHIHVRRPQASFASKALMYVHVCHVHVKWRVW